MTAAAQPKVSVSIITYNHARYIAQAVESALMQQTDFPFEIVIGEDKSTDGTREIVKNLAKGHGDRIRLLLHERKHTSTANGRPTGNWNFANNVKQCRGKYIALLDGDDYWTSPLKLQKQADFVDANDDCAMCYHNVRILDERNPERVELAENKTGRKTLKNLLRGNFMQTCSVMFRAGLFGDFPEWFYRSPLGDWPLHVLNGRFGDIGYIDEVMGVYRKHSSGAWSQHEEIASRAGTIQSAELLRECLNPSDQKYLDRNIARWYRKLVEACKAEGDKDGVKKYCAEYERFRESKGARGMLSRLFGARPG